MSRQPIKVEKSNQLFERAKKVVPGGANQAHRKYEYENAVFPFIESGEGSKIYDVDKNEYIDYHCAFGPIILGRNYPSVNQAVKDAIDAKLDLFGVGGTEAATRQRGAGRRPRDRCHKSKGRQCSVIDQVSDDL